MPKNVTFPRCIGYTWNKDFDQYLLEILAKNDSCSIDEVKEKLIKYEEMFNPLCKQWRDSNFTDFSVYEHIDYKYTTIPSFYMETRPTLGQLQTKFRENNIDLNSISSVLDFGCAIGLTTILLSRIFPNAEIVAHEQSEDELGILNKIIEDHNIENIVISESLPTNRNFDLICMFEMIEHTPDPITFFLDNILPVSGKYLAYSARWSKPYVGHFDEFINPLQNNKKVGTRIMAREFKKVVKQHFNHIATGFNSHGIFFEKN
jgi:SAM-dependent methyltransferase